MLIKGERDMTVYSKEEWNGPDLRARWPNISWSEASCSETKTCLLDPNFIDLIQRLRTELGFPLNFSSMYRSEVHPVEAVKIRRGKLTGSHALGCAVDIVIHSSHARRLLALALQEEAITGVGLSQTGAKARRFIHLDGMSEKHCIERGVQVDWNNRLWTY